MGIVDKGKEKIMKEDESIPNLSKTVKINPNDLK